MNNLSKADSIFDGQALNEWTSFNTTTRQRERSYVKTKDWAR